MTWINYFVTSLAATGSEGHIDADRLRARIQSHGGGEAYHCAFDLVKEELIGGTVAGYKGIFRPAMGYVWFDFDSHKDEEKNLEAGEQALIDTRKFVQWLGIDDAFICYSGSKGFHVGVPFGYFGLEPSTTLGVALNALAKKLKETYPSIDTTVFNANRKFRALGSKHPKTGLYKIAITKGMLEIHDIKRLQVHAKVRNDLGISLPELRSPLTPLQALFHVEQPGASEKLQQNKSNKNAGEKKWEAPTGEAAYAQCGFLGHAKANPKTITEPQWYAALSIVSRFQEGRKQCHALSDGHPGYSVSDCNKKIDQALELPPRTCESINTLWDGCKTCPLWGKIASPVNLFETRFWTVGKKGGLIPQYDKLLEHFKKRNAFKTIADMKAVYVYNGTHYEEYTPIEIKAFAEESFEPKPKERERQEFYSKVLASNVGKRIFFTEGTEGKINFKNGVLDAAHQTLSPHSPDLGFRNVLPYDYNLDQSCPTFTWWIKDVMLGDEKLVAILQEFMGYVVRGGEYKYHKALWLAGTGRNGKSTFLHVMKALIGDSNYSALSIKSISQDKFSSADLDGKIANFSEETSPEELSDSSQFKNLTGDGEVNAQKKYGDPYKFRNRAKLIMTYNEVPELRDLSPGMTSRPIIVPWEKDLTADELQDKGLKEKLLKELPGIFNFAWEGWKRLEAQGGFTYSEKSEAAKQSVREASCSAFQWIDSYVTFLPINANSANREVRTPQELYEHFKDVEGRYAYKAVKFFRRINEHKEIAKRRRTTKNSAEYFSLMLKQRASFDARKMHPQLNAENSRDVPPVEF